MTRSLSRSYAYCERLTRREAGNFYHAFRVLPGAQRRAMCALYAFMRVADDLSDDAGPVELKSAALQAWRASLDAALAGDFSHRLHEAFHDTVRFYGIPREYLLAVLDGVEMDLAPVRFATFADLYPYCYRVASAVGLSCIHIWGFREEQAKVHAESAGIAFQLTNILRDIAEDAARGRVYLPQEDLQRFGCTQEQLKVGLCDQRFQDLMRFEVARARDFYARGWPLTGLLQPAGRAVFQVMMRTYQGLLDAIERRQYDVFRGRVRLSTWHKIGLALQSLPVRYGWGGR